MDCFLGNLGSVMKESAQLALSWIKSHVSQYPVIPPSSFNKLDFHIHFPSGAVPKDGPSAGITIVCALLSQLTRQPLLPGFAMTGELSLHGQVLKVGGIREKVLAAYSRGIRRFVLPSGNRTTWAVDLDLEVRETCDWTFVETVDDVVGRVFGMSPISKIEARL